MGATIEDKLFLDRFNVADDSHLKIKDDAACADVCEDKPSVAATPFHRRPLRCLW